jgi:hypothetical protein
MREERTTQFVSGYDCMIRVNLPGRKSKCNVPFSDQIPHGTLLSIRSTVSIHGFDLKSLSYVVRNIFARSSDPDEN